MAKELDALEVTFELNQPADANLGAIAEKLSPALDALVRKVAGEYPADVLVQISVCRHGTPREHLHVHLDTIIRRPG